MSNWKELQNEVDSASLSFLRAAAKELERRNEEAAKKRAITREERFWTELEGRAKRLIFPEELPELVRSRKLELDDTSGLVTRREYGEKRTLKEADELVRHIRMTGSKFERFVEFDYSKTLFAHWMSEQSEEDLITLANNLEGLRKQAKKLEKVIDKVSIAMTEERRSKLSPEERFREAKRAQYFHEWREEGCPSEGWLADQLSKLTLPEEVA